MYGASKSANAAKQGGWLQANAATESLAFQKQQAAAEQANFEATQKANYDQWRAKEVRMSQLGNLLGMPGRQIPNYVPTTAGAILNPTTPGTGGPRTNAGLLLRPPTT